MLIDLDPCAASTKWFGVQPTAEGMHVGAILGDEHPEGWAEDLAVPSGWHLNLRVIPSACNVSNREADRADHAQLPLLISLTGLSADVVVIDCPNRPRRAADPVGVERGGHRGLRRHRHQRRHRRRWTGPGAQSPSSPRHRQQRSTPDTLTEADIVVGGVKGTIMSRAAVASLEELRATGLFLEPLIPDRAIVQEVRI